MLFSLSHNRVKSTVQQTLKITHFRHYVTKVQKSFWVSCIFAYIFRVFFIVFFAFLLCPFLFVLFKLPAHFPVYFSCGQRFPREVHLSRHLYALVDGMRNIQFKHFWLKCFGNVWISITFVILIQTVKKL